MREGTIRILTFVALLWIAGLASAEEAVWISANGDEHTLGHHEFLFAGDGDSFDLSDLEDGETRVFGSGDKQLTASRDGETVRLERAASGDERALKIECELGQDTCRVMTFGEDLEKVAIMIEKRHRGHQVMTIDEDVVVGEDGETTIVIKSIGDCGCGEENECDCMSRKIEMLAGSVHMGEMVVEAVVDDDGELHKNVWVGHGGAHGHAMMISEGGTKHDLSELYDGETRIFGYGEKQVTAVRDGDQVSVSRTGGEDATADVLVTCTVGRDACYVMTYDDDPEKVAVVISKTAGCAGAADDCDADLLHLKMMDGQAGNVEIIELREGDPGTIVVSDPGADKQTIRRIKIVREEDD